VAPSLTPTPLPAEQIAPALLLTGTAGNTCADLHWARGNDSCSPRSLGLTGGLPLPPLSLADTQLPGASNRRVGAPLAVVELTLANLSKQVRCVGFSVVAPALPINSLGCHPSPHS
jgi:hypothetical protein